MAISNKMEVCPPSTSMLELFSGYNRRGCVFQALPCSFSIRSTSRSRTSRMKPARRLVPTSLSIRSPSPSGKRTLVDLRLSGGLPMLSS